MVLNTAESYTSNRLEETVRWHGSEHGRVAHQPNRLEETVRWHGSEHGRVVHQPNRLVRDCEVAWL